MDEIEKSKVLIAQNPTSILKPKVSSFDWLNESYSNILLHYVLHHYKLPEKDKVLSWYMQKYSLPIELWIYICRFLPFDCVILLSSTNRYMNNTLQDYICNQKKQHPIAHITVCLKNEKDYAYTQFVLKHKIPLYLPIEIDKECMLFSKCNQTKYVQFQWKYLLKSLFNFFSQSECVSNSLCTSLYEKQLIAEINSICKSYSNFDESVWHTSSYLSKGKSKKILTDDLLRYSRKRAYTDGNISHFNYIFCINTFRILICNIDFVNGMLMYKNL